MRRVSRMISFTLLVCTLVEVRTQVKETPARLSLTSNVDGSEVYIDSVRVGITPLLGYAVEPGKHTVCVAPPADLSWMRLPACREIEVGGHTEERIELPLLRYLRITSEPFGARAVYSDSAVGETPLFLPTNAAAGVITLSKYGYGDLTLVFDASTQTLHGVLRGREPHHGSLYLDNQEANDVTVIVVTASSAVLTGVAAAYWKLRADDLYSDYRRTGNSEQLDRIRNLDLASAIALGASQISLGLLIYLLMSR